mmetsp:Transcript_86700/g.144191  ORF Transcript_86700/g.144191 Transcript_86700/m.144191 type:complete len:346 (-) Transcript_86700:573-1610(-)
MASTAAETEAVELGLLERWQADRGFWQGAAVLTAMVSAAYLLPTETGASALVSTCQKFRAIGLNKEHVPDEVLMNDYFRRNALAGYNVLLASPAFYFLWHLTHNAGFSTSLVRSITGSVRIVPFLTVLYGGCAVTLPMMTGALMARGQKYEEAQSNATAGLMLSGVAMLEALVELRGCGVTFAQMTPSALMCFFPALIGRLAAGVLTQQQKIGKEFQNVLPEEWKTAEGTQAQLYKFFDMLCIDRAFFSTVVGTTVFQHILNGITYVLLMNGQATRMWHVGAYLTGGLNGTAGSAMHQLGKCLGLRLGFCGVWNWLSAQPPPRLSVIDEALKILRRQEEGREAQK